MEEVRLVLGFIGGIGAPELLVIFAIVLLLFGGKKLPEVARSMGSAMRAFKEEANQLRREVELEAEHEAEHEEESTKAQAASNAAEKSGSETMGETSDTREKETEKVEQKG